MLAPVGLVEVLQVWSVVSHGRPFVEPGCLTDLQRVRRVSTYGSPPPTSLRVRTARAFLVLGAEPALRVMLCPLRARPHSLESERIGPRWRNRNSAGCFLRRRLSGGCWRSQPG